VEVKEIVREYRSLYAGGSWEETLRVFMEDPVEAGTVSDLREELRTRGCFERPVRLGLNGNDEPSVVNGTHRVLAALLEGVRDVDAGPDAEGSGTEVGTTYVVRFKASGEVPAGRDDLFDFGWSVLRSFSHPGGWLESEELGADGDEFECCWKWEGTPQDLVEVLTKRGAAHGLNLSGFSITEEVPWR
jgi:hypothetical protein